MDFSRRDFLRASAAVAAAFGIKLPEALAADNSGPNVIWLQGAGCSGCSVSLLNSIHYMGVDTLLTQTINLKFHSTLMTAAGQLATNAASAVPSGYVLVVEGAIPTGASADYCHVGPGKSIFQAVLDFAPNAALILAVGACATFGGIPRAFGSTGNCLSLNDVLTANVPAKTAINIPGCPAHPDWVVGTIAWVLAHPGQLPELDGYNCPTMFNAGTVVDAGVPGQRIHDVCPRRPAYDVGDMTVCLLTRGCNGKHSYIDCASRKWNAGAVGGVGVNWCIDSGSPCLGCVQPGFPDACSPFHSDQKYQ